MKYLCILFVDTTKFNALSPTEATAFDAESMSYDEDLQRSGHYIVAEALQSAQNATTLRVHNGKVSITDGPFIETKEQMGGFMLIEAKDLNDAIQVASKIPLARFGSVEIRPVLQWAGNSQ